MLITDPNAPAKQQQAERQRMRLAAGRALRLYPGPLGELVHRELTSWEEFGFRFGNGPKALVNRVVEQIMSAPAP